jgi:hypothetical protein
MVIKIQNDNPQAMRERAERAFRLASTTTDDSAHDALILYGQELLAEAERIEAEPKDPYAGS